MKDTLQNFANARPYYYQSSRGRKQQAYQVYKRVRRKQQRIALLVLGALGILLLCGAAVWGALNLRLPTLSWTAWTPPAIFTPANTDTSAFEAAMEKDLGLSAAPSLLYYNSLDYALHAKHESGKIKDKLLPIMATHEDTQLKDKLEQLFANYPANFVPHFYYYNPADASYVEINGYTPVSAASVIKLPILLRYLVSLDDNMMRMNSPVLYADFHRAGGSGDWQYKLAGDVFPVNDVAAEMIRISDNTCTNIMISNLGGIDAVNQKLAKLGLVHTRIRNPLPDLEGTNTISAYEMATILYNIDQGPLLSNVSRDDGIGILERTHNRSLLVSPLPEDVKVAHKTGDIGTALGDSGMVYMPDGQKYIISMQVERPYNDYTARDIVQRASRLIYDHVAANHQEGTLVQANSGL